MRTLRFLLLGIPLILLAVTRPVVAAPATVTNLEFCYFVWGGFDTDNMTRLVLLEGTGVVVESNNSGGNASYYCRGQIDFGAKVTALRLFSPPNYVEVVLATIEEACDTFPDACRGNNNGAFIGTVENTGVECEIPGVGPTANASQLVTPGGQVRTICHLPE